MLTRDKIKVYQQFDGDMDGLSRNPSINASVDISGVEWKLIDELCQALSIISSGQASPEFAATTEQKLIVSIADPQAQQALRDYVATRIQGRCLPSSS